MILASQSPRRLELMKDAGYDIQVQPANIDETPLANETPLELVERLACSKAQYVSEHHATHGEVVLAADTVVALRDTILGKPTDEEDAKRMLHMLSGTTHQVATGVCIMCGSGQRSFVGVADVTFYALSDEEIAAYVATGEPMDKAGAYGIQGTHGRLLIQKISGDFYTVVGLPIARVVRELKAFNC